MPNEDTHTQGGDQWDTFNKVGPGRSGSVDAMATSWLSLPENLGNQMLKGYLLNTALDFLVHGVEFDLCKLNSGEHRRFILHIVAEINEGQALPELRQKKSSFLWWNKKRTIGKPKACKK